MSRVIYKDTVSQITLISGTENAEYPLSNLRDAHPRKPFRTTGNTCTLRLSDNGEAAAVALVMTNAIDIEVTSVLSVVYSWGEASDGTAIAAGEDAAGEAIAWVDDTAAEYFDPVQYVNYDGENGIAYIGFEPAPWSREIDVTLTALDAEYVSIGLLVAGKTMRFRDFERASYQITSTDTSTQVELNDGSTWYKPGKVLRQPSGYIVMHSDPTIADPDGHNSYEEFMDNLWFSLGKTALVWQLSESGKERSIYASIELPPVAVMHGMSAKMVSINLKEQV